MELTELCSLHATTPSSHAVPAWSLGCFRRRSITFFNGDSDESTFVVWLQSRGLTADLRLAVDRPRPQAREELAQLSVAELTRLAEAEGGISAARSISSDRRATRGNGAARPRTNKACSPAITRPPP